MQFISKMDQNQVPSFPFLLTLLLIIILVMVRIILKESRPNLPKIPPGPPKLPIIGNLHLMIGELPHRRLFDLAKTYGSIMHLQLGEIPTIVFSSIETAKLVFKTHDLIFSGRPHFHSLKVLTYNHTDIAMAPYGDYQKQIRKICTTQLLSHSHVRSFRPIREDEVTNLVKDLVSRAGCVVNLKEMLYSTVLTIISRAALGGKSSHQEGFEKLVPDIVELYGGLSLIDLFPSFKLLRVFHDMMPKSKKLHQQADEILEKIVMEHREKRAAGWTDKDDLVYVLLDLQDRGELDVPLTTDNIKAIIMDMFLAGSETSTIAVEWAMSEMLKNPQVMEKAQAEVRQVFASKGRVDEAELGELKYMNSVIKETLRVHPPAPLMIPRETRERCEINGYEIPAKSRVFMNAWAVGRDPNYWTEAEKFFPERFLDSKADYKGDSFEFIPFGGGRRVCVGISLATSIIEIELANLLYHFDWKLPEGQSAEDLDMTEVFRAVAKRKHDLCLVPIPYHPPML